MKVLITGGDGFVGRHFRKVLACEEVTNIDILSGKDCRDFFKWDRRQFDLVIHLAAVVGGRAFIESSPLVLASEDLSIDSAMWQWALKTRPGRIVYYSSSAAYPRELQVSPGRRLVESDIDLDAVANPDFSYGWVKLTGEVMARYAREQGLNVSVFRPFSGYGSTQDLTYPWPSFIKRAKQKDAPFEVWGDGNQTRDWIHITDVVSATLRAVELGLDGPFNLCTGVTTSFKELAQICMDVAGYEAPIKMLEDMPAGCHYRVGDPGKMLEFYQPKVALRDAIEEALR